MNDQASTQTVAHAGKVAMGETLLEVKNLVKHFPVTEGVIFNSVVGQVKAVDGVSFTVAKGETLGLVGESGCGKTTTGRCILQLERATAGDIVFEGTNLVTLNEKSLSPFRQKIQVIFQDPYSSLNPRMKIGDILGEPMKVHNLYPDVNRRNSPRGRIAWGVRLEPEVCRPLPPRDERRSAPASRHCARVVTQP